MEDLVVVVAESKKVNNNTEDLNAAKNNYLVVAADDDDAKTMTVANQSTQRKQNKTEKNLIQVSGHKKPFLFYLNLAKRYIKKYNYVELCALGMAIPTVVSISEILKCKGLAIQKSITISTASSKKNNKGRLIQKAKIEIVMEKAEKLNEITTVSASKKAADTLIHSMIELVMEKAEKPDETTAVAASEQAADTNA